VAVTQPDILTIPSSDTAFRRQVERLRDAAIGTPEEFEVRLRRLFPRAVVRRRDIVGEPPAWYVYRDGSWRPDLIGEWWEQAGLPKVTAAPDGWILEANPAALGLLGIEPADVRNRHFTDFVAPGSLDDSVAMFAIVAEGHPLSATVILRPASGDVVSIDIHAWRDGDVIVSVFRLADDVDVVPEVPIVVRPEVECHPRTDAAFRGYVDLALRRMPEPTPDGLALRLRRLYPHASVEGRDGRWSVRRDGDAPRGTEAEPAIGDRGTTEGGGTTEGAGWWTDPSLARVRYDAQALILEANEAASDLLGHSLVGHHWQEFVTPGSTEQVSAMLAILAEVGSAESRFRMPRADGSLLEFDSWTQVDGDGFTTVMRPRP
jgi:PAS domain-containing protein